MCKGVKATLVVIGLIGALILISGGMKSDPSKGGFEPRPKRVEAPEYNCLKHAKDGICEVPVNGKVVLYCVKPPLKRIVHYREECK